MNYSQYYPVDVLNGEGTRCVLFVSGCEHFCKGCYNKKTWSFDAGEPFTSNLEDTIIKDLNDTRIKRKGLTLTGGDPLHPKNLSVITKLVERVLKECPNKDIWVWSGYTLNQLTDEQKKLINLVDVFIDGKFEQDTADPSLLWRGSANQIIHRFK